MTNPITVSSEPLGRFRTDLVVEPQKKDGAAGAYRILDPVSNISHVLTELEYAVATCMNGERNVMDVARAAARLGHPVQVEHVERFHRELEGMSFVFRDQAPLPASAPAPTHRDDAKRFVEEAKRELSLGRVQAARDLLDAALAIDRGDQPSPPQASPAPRASAGPALYTSSSAPFSSSGGEALGPVLDYLKGWDPAAPGAAPPSAAPAATSAPLTTSSAPVAGEPTRAPVPSAFAPGETGTTNKWSAPDYPVLPPIDISMDDIAEVPAPRRARGRWVAAAAAVVALAAGAGAATGVLPTDAFASALDGAAPLTPIVTTSAPLAGAPPGLAMAPPPVLAVPTVSSTPPADAPVAVAPVSPDAPVAVAPVAVAPISPDAPVVSPDAPVAPVSDTPVAAPSPAARDVAPEDAAVPAGGIDVTSTVKGKFARALVSSGVKVKSGQRVAVVMESSGKKAVLTSPADGIFEARAVLGKAVAPGDVVGVVHPW